MHFPLSTRSRESIGFRQLAEVVGTWR